MVKYNRSLEQMDIVIFKKYKNEAQSWIRAANWDYYAELIKENKEDPKKLCTELMVLECGGEKNSRISRNNGIDMDGRRFSF